MSTVADRLGPVQAVAARTRTQVFRVSTYLREELADDIVGLHELLHQARELWSAICREVVAGRTEQAHGDRAAHNRAHLESRRNQDRRL